MAFDPVLGWDSRVFVKNEAVWGTAEDVAAASAIECISCDMGPSEVGEVRPQQDKTQGRGLTSKFTEGRVKPISFNIETSVKSRSAVDTVPKESALYQSAGLIETITGGVSVAYGFSSNPTLKGLTAHRFLGTNPTTYEGRQGRGGAIKQLTWSGGDKDLVLKAAGAFAGSRTFGYIDSVTLADGVGTALAVATADESYRLIAGTYMIIESEVIKIVSVSYGNAAGHVIARSQLSTAGAAHAAKPLMPYYPALTLAGSPISEPNCTVSYNGTTLRVTGWDITLDTGVDHLPGESGSKYVQGPKALRYNVKGSLKMVYHKEDVTLVGRAFQRPSGALSIAQGAGTGQIATFALPTCEVEPFAAPDTKNDVAQVTVNFRARDNSGNDMLQIILT